jgi:hypothetical protein
MGRTVLVHNHRAGVELLGGNPYPPAGEPQVPEFMLKPGVNEVPVETWKLALKSPVIQHKLQPKVKVLEVLETKRGKSEFSAFSEAEQLDIVEETMDVDLLKEWGESAKGKVSKAIDKRIDFMKEPLKPQR